MLQRGRARRAGETALALERHRAATRPLVVELLAFALALLSGALLMQQYGWGLTHARWLGVKLGLVAFLLVPLAAMHAWVLYAWLRPGLRESRAGELSQAFRRGLGVEEMLRTLELLLLTPGVPLLVWLSLRKPF